jgi:hypothetical protein
MRSGYRMFSVVSGVQDEAPAILLAGPNRALSDVGLLKDPTTLWDGHISLSYDSIMISAFF